MGEEMSIPDAIRAWGRAMDEEKSISGKQTVRIEALRAASRVAAAMVGEGYPSNIEELTINLAEHFAKWLEK